MGDTAILIVAGVLLAAIVIYGAYIVIRGRKSEVEERLGRYTAGIEVEAPKQEKRASPIGERLDRALAGRGIAENIRIQLARADLKLTVSEYLAATVISVVLAAAAGMILFRSPLLAMVAGVVGFFAPRWYVGFLQRKRLRTFNNQLSDTINLMVNSIRAGYSVLQAMEAVAEEMSPPTSEEFHRVVREVQLGLSMEEALNNLLRRVRSDDLDLMVTAMNVQREVGGNLAEVLDAISYTIRERVRIQGEIRALTAQGRWSGYIVSFLPLVVSVAMYFLNRDFFIVMIENPCGWIMIGVAIGLLVAGYIVIQKIVTIEV
jgi:tight adherence protein B